MGKTATRRAREAREKPFLCSDCSKRCATQAGLDEHIRATHQKKRWRLGKVICPYCGQPAEFLENSAPIYAGTDWGPVYACRPCEAWVGCHDGTHRPLGRLANRELRAAKRAAHAVFDPLWEAKQARTPDMSKGQARRAGYRWLAGQLGIAVDACHIGMFDVDRCHEVVKVCRKYYKDKYCAT